MDDDDAVGVSGRSSDDSDDSDIVVGVGAIERERANTSIFAPTIAPNDCIMYPMSIVTISPRFWMLDTMSEISA